MQCEPGLFCLQRDDDEDIPGCNGDAEDGVDYCIPEFYRDSVRNLKKTASSVGLRNNKAPAPKNNVVRKLQGDAVVFQTTRTYALTLEGDDFFRGFLFRLSGADGQDLSNVFETTGAETQIMASTGEAIGIPGVAPGSCAVGVSGATHTNNDDKEFAEVLMTIPSSAAGELNLEVTAMVNEDLWYATTYTIIAQDVENMEIPVQVVPTTPPVAAPVAAPVSTPVGAPTTTAPEPTAGGAPSGPAPTAGDAGAPSAEVLPEGVVRFPSSGDPNEVEFKPVGQCTGETGLCMQCEGMGNLRFICCQC